MLNKLNLILTPITAIISSLASWESNIVSRDVDDFKKQVDILTDTTRSKKEREGAIKALRKIADRAKPAERMNDAIQEFSDKFKGIIGPELFGGFDVSDFIHGEDDGEEDADPSGVSAYQRFVDDSKSGSLPHRYAQFYSILQEFDIHCFGDLLDLDKRDAVLSRVGHFEYNQFSRFIRSKYGYKIYLLAAKKVPSKRDASL